MRYIIIGSAIFHTSEKIIQIDSTSSKLFLNKCLNKSKYRLSYNPLNLFLFKNFYRILQLSCQELFYLFMFLENNINYQKSIHAYNFDLINYMLLILPRCNNIYFQNYVRMFLFKTSKSQ